MIDPVNNLDEVLDILIESGRIAKVGKALKTNKGFQVIEAKGKIVCPGLVDMHVHLREPGREDEETIGSGTRAAAKGGFTSIACMPNTDPPIDNASVVELILDKAEKEGIVNVFPVASFTKGLKGEELSEMSDLLKAGAVCFSNDGESVTDAEVMRRVLEYTKMFDACPIIHAEDKNLSDKGQMNEGYFSTLLGLRGIPAAAEEVIIARDLTLAALGGAKVHFTHISTKGSVELIKTAKKKGCPVTCDVTPHHLTLTEENLLSYDTNLKVNPPLRSKEDVKALREALTNGTIDAIASDHAPHAPQEKEREFEYTPFGMTGLETSLSLMLTELVEKEVLSYKELVEKMSVNPIKILGIDQEGRGTLSKGSVADVTIIDPQAQVEVDQTKFESKSGNTPFAGWKLKGEASHVIVGGNLVWSRSSE